MTEVFDHLKQRLKHPFLGSLSISFILWNWRAFLFATTGDLSPSERIQHIVEVTTDSGVTKQWTFLIEPLIAALIVSLIILPVGSLVVGLVLHCSIVIEGNLRDLINRKWNKSDILKYRHARDLCVYASGRIGQLRNHTNANNPVPANVVQEHLDEARNALQGIGKDDLNEITRTWQNLRNQNKIQ